MKELSTYAVHFCGIGGACHGIEQAGLKCKVAIDYLPLAVEYRERNLGHKAIQMDITQYVPVREHDADLLWTSPSCQSFSTSSREAALAKKDAKIEDKRDNLFLCSLEYVKFARPMFVVLENVTGMLTHNKGDTIRTIIGSFKALGYHVEYNVLNSRYWLPQDRERLFIVASRDGQKGLIPNEPYKPEILGADGKPVYQYPTFGSVMQDGRYDLALQPCSYRTIVEKVGRLSAQNGQPFGIKLLDREDVLPTLTCGFGGGVTRKKVAVFDFVPGQYDVPFVRHISAREGARAQGFPDEWQLPSSETDAWTLVGNAVSSPVAKHIIEHLRRVAAGEKPPSKGRLTSIPTYVEKNDEMRTMGFPLRGEKAHQNCEKSEN